MNFIGPFLKDLFTGVSGRDYALAKVLAAINFVLGWIAYLGVGLRFLIAKGTLISDWALFFQFGAVWLAAITAASISLMSIQPKSEGGLIGQKEPEQ